MLPLVLRLALLPRFPIPQPRVHDEPAVLADVRKVTTATEQSELYALAERITGASGERNERERLD